MSTQTVKVLASNDALSLNLWNASFMVGGFVLALIFAVTWKG